MSKQTAKIPSSRPPIVAVLGHVDHGKTTLLDTIRKTNVAASEHGGITQHIGAYQIEIPQDLSSHEAARKGTKSDKKAVIRQTQGDKSQGRFITFIDTPGHEAFSKMRARGASVADIAILVVAADDSVKPQTVESINQIKSAGIPMIIALNKIDLPTANPEKVKSDLARAGVQVEGFGGDVPVALISAKAGTGVRELLDLILLVSEMKGLSNSPTGQLEAPVIETRIDKGKGMTATIVIRQGTLRGGMSLYDTDRQIAKVRAMFDDQGKIVTEALPGRPVEVLGFSTLPYVGSVLHDAPIAKNTEQSVGKVQPVGFSLPDFLKPVAEQQKEKLKIVLKADMAGSLEAITGSLDPQVQVVGQGVGDITDADILQAKATGAIVIGFNIRIRPQVAKLAQTEKVIFRTYAIIYELLQELSEVVAGLKAVLHEERELGLGQIIAEFPFEKMRIAGTKITSGRLARGDTVKIMRGDTEVSRAKIKSLRQGKSDVTKAETGVECGILFDRVVDFKLQDAIIAVTI